MIIPSAYKTVELPRNTSPEERIMKKISICILVLVFGFFCTAGVSSSRADWSANEAQELVEKGTVVFKSFMSDPDSNLDWLRENVVNAKALLIVPQLLKAGFFLGGSGGTGVLVAWDKEKKEWSYPIFYTMGSVSFGFQLGAEAAEVILMVMTERGMDAMLTTNFKLGADVSIAAGPIGAGIKKATADVLSFSRTKGAYGGMSIEGAVIKTRDKMNSSYYGQEVSPADVIIRRKVENSKADELRKVIAEGPPKKK